MAATQIQPVFNDRINDLQRVSGKLHDALTGQGQREWMTPEDWTGDPLKISELHLPSFDRTEINSAYTAVMGGDLGGSAGEAASLKLQLDYMAVMERAFRSRHASPIRCLMHAAARHYGQSSPAGVFGAVRNYAQDLIQAGGESQ